MTGKCVAVFDDEWRLFEWHESASVVAAKHAIGMTDLQLPVVDYTADQQHIRYGYMHISGDDPRWPEAVAYHLQRMGVRAFPMPHAAHEVLGLLSSADISRDDRYAAVRELMHMREESVAQMYAAMQAQSRSILKK